ncbi:OmpA family protein [Gemmatimonas sp.]|uniref:OmpA family protein n=1 Tax=Gemmatimonas sp. TaxID=1962908 RepID=UPI00334272C4
MSNARSIWSAIISVTLWQLSGETLGAQPTTWVTPRAARTTDAVIARDLATFDSLARVAPSPRSAAVIGLARDAYERNDAGPLSERLLSLALRRDNDPRLRAVRGELWALLDSVDTHNAQTDQQRELAVALEVALLRAGSPVLGAPSCAAWEQEALRIATSLRAVPAPPIPPAAPVAAPVTIIAPPAPVPALAVPREMRGVPSRVHFALDKHALAPASRRVLDALIDSLANYGDVQVTLEGHTDVRGSVAYNQALSARRVEAVRQYVESKGIAASRIRLVARGKSQLENDRSGVVDHARNRRVLLRYFTPDGREIAAVQQLDDLQLERR